MYVGVQKEIPCPVWSCLSACRIAWDQRSNLDDFSYV